MVSTLLYDIHLLGSEVEDLILASEGKNETQLYPVADRVMDAVNRFAASDPRIAIADAMELVNSSVFDTFRSIVPSQYILCGGVAFSLSLRERERPETERPRELLLTYMSTLVESAWSKDSGVSSPHMIDFALAVGNWYTFGGTSSPEVMIELSDAMTSLDPIIALDVVEKTARGEIDLAPYFAVGLRDVNLVMRCIRDGVTPDLALEMERESG